MDSSGWTYSPTPGITEPSSWIIRQAWRTWARDLGGHVHWHTTLPDSDGFGTDARRYDPFFESKGACTLMIYPGERFGIAGPIPTTRLKVQRNAVQDINLLEMVGQARGKDAVRGDLLAGIPIELWHEQSVAQRTLPPWEWGVSNLRVEPANRPTKPLDPLWWEPVREYARTRAMEVSHA